MSEVLEIGLSTIDGVEYWLRNNSLETVLDDAGCCWYGGESALEIEWRIVRETSECELLEWLLDSNWQRRTLATRQLARVCK